MIWLYVLGAFVVILILNTGIAKGLDKIEERKRRKFEEKVDRYRR
jgi:hypothetical protein